MMQDPTKTPNTNAGILSYNGSLEFFKLEEIDRHVFFWLIDNPVLRSTLRSWLDFISNDYCRRMNIIINVDRLHIEAKLCLKEK